MSKKRNQESKSVDKPSSVVAQAAGGAYFTVGKLILMALGVKFHGERHMEFERGSLKVEPLSDAQRHKQRQREIGRRLAAEAPDREKNAACAKAGREQRARLERTKALVETMNAQVREGIELTDYKPLRPVPPPAAKPGQSTDASTVTKMERLPPVPKSPGGRGL